MTAQSTPVALVTGANRGIGLEVTRQLARAGYTTLLGCRSLDRGHAAADQLSTAGLRVRALHLDITDQASIAAAVEDVEQNHARLDVLINNAAVCYDDWQSATTADLRLVAEALDTNLFGTWHTTQALLSLLRRSPHPRIVNVSSGAGALADMSGGLPAYRISKVSLNALTRMWAAELAADRILVNAVCPGWVATDMGGPGGRSVVDGAAGIVWAVTLPDDGPTGGFYRDRRPIPW